MEIENHKEEVPFEHYLEKYKSLDPKEAAQRLNIVYDETEQKFHLHFMGHPYEVHFPEFEIIALDEEEKDGLLMTSLPAKTFILRYLLEGQYVQSSGKFMTFREVPTYGELYIQPFTGRCIKRLTYGFGFKLKAFAEGMEKIWPTSLNSLTDIECSLFSGQETRNFHPLPRFFTAIISSSDFTQRTWWWRETCPLPL